MKMGGTAQVQGRSWDLGQVAALLGGFVGGFGAITTMSYLLGFYTLWIPIVLNYTHDIVTSTYAVSIVPATTVISNGLISILIPTVLAALIVGSFALPDVLSTPRKRNLSRALLIFVFLAYILWVAFLRFTADTPSARPTLIDLVVEVFVLALTLIGIVFWALRTLKKYLNRSFRFVRDHEQVRLVISHRDFLKAIAAFFTVSLLISMSAATAAVRPPLPEANVDRTQDAKSVKGTLLTHTDGFWYILDQEKAEVVAITDSEVSAVHLHPKKANDRSFLP
jgi:hypothetical protein